MNACIFLGPTLDVEAARRELDGVSLPPAAYGDIYRATLRQPPPRVIGLIDGYFRQQPAVRHKEILWAMAQGIHVFGAASMGALRAAELKDFGMNGVGRIFELLRDGTLEDDDEVAIDHGPAGLGYIALNDAMVDIRATFAAAVAGSVIGKDTERVLVDIAKKLFFAERTYDTIFERARNSDLSIDEISTLRHWLRTNRRNQKRDDAVALLTVIRDFLIIDPLPKKTNFVFERTETWDIDVAFATPLDHATEAKTETHFLTRVDLLDELRLVPAEYQAARQEALTRILVLREFQRQGTALAENEIAAAKRKWSQSHNLYSSQDILEWCRVNHVNEVGLDIIVKEEAIRNSLESMADELIDRHLIAALRARDTYGPLAHRGLAKQVWFATNAAETDAAEMSTYDLVAWFCESRLGRPLPQNIDDFALQLGFASSAELHRAVLREFLYQGTMKSVSADPRIG